MVRAPMRISFAGGGTDVEPYVSEHGGCVISAAIQMYAYGEYSSETHEPSDIEKTIAEYFNKDASRLRVTSEAPPMSGLGGSASCFVAGIKAVRPELKGKELAELAFHLERDVMGVRGGKQDQYAASLGGLNYMTFTKDDVDVIPLPVPANLENLLMLVYMGKRNHNGHDIINDQMSRDNDIDFDFQKDIARLMMRVLAESGLTSFGLLLNGAWKSKVRLSPYITTPEIDQFHQSCLEHGAIAGKLTGAGGGGYMLFMEDPRKQGELRNYLEDYQNIRFDLEGAR